MKWLFLGFVVCAACGKGNGALIETLADPGVPLSGKTEAVCKLAASDGEDARTALGTHVKVLLKEPQTDVSARNAQIDCVAKEVKANLDSGFRPYADNIARAYVLNPSEAVKATLSVVSKGQLQDSVSKYLYDLVTDRRSGQDLKEAAPRISELLDHTKREKQWVSGEIVVLWARTGDATLKARIDAAPPARRSEALDASLAMVEAGPAADRKPAIEKLIALASGQGSAYFNGRACKLAPDAAGCDALAAKPPETPVAPAGSTANPGTTSPLVDILQPVQQAAAKAAPQGKTPAWITEAGGGDPSPVDEVIPEVPEMEAAIAKIIAAGAALHKDCKTYMAIGGIGGLTCARALGKQKVELLTAATLEHLATYNTMYASDGKKAHRFGSGVVIGLRALEGFTGESVDDVFLQSLSAVDPALAKLVIEKVKARSKLEPVVDGLFRFMARKDRFGAVEIDNYVGLLTSYGGSVTVPVVKNLERELAKAKRPERVYWAHKLVSLTALEKVGTRDALPILDKYAADTSGYRSMKTSVDTGAEVSGRDIAFADTVAKTRRAIATR